MPLYHSGESIGVNIEWFLTSAGITAEEFYKRWQKYLTMTVQFINLNLLDDDAVDKLIALSTDCVDGVYIWTSNSFFMEYIMFFKSRAWTIKKQSDFITELSNKSKITTVLENCGQLTFVK